MTDLATRMVADAALLHVLQHSLGVDEFGRGDQYRNRFVTGEGSTDHPTCLEAVDRGLMDRHAGNTLTGDMDLFVVTDQGRNFVAQHSPRPDRKQKARDRYSRFLDLSDVMPDLTFQSFLKEHC